MACELTYAAGADGAAMRGEVKSLTKDMSKVHQGTHQLCLCNVMDILGHSLAYFLSVSFMTGHRGLDDALLNCKAPRSKLIKSHEVRGTITVLC